MTNEIENCFKENFTQWLLQSNCPDVGPFKGDWWQDLSRMRRGFDKIKSNSLQSILDILITCPEADYFWYNHSSNLTYSLPHHEVVPSGSIRIDSDKVKMLLRDIKINQILE